jgi:L-ascorbate metabolism protein UlaG (beta-lactamase superfamily)
MRITLIGHMTVMIDMDGVFFLTDPWFGPCNFAERMLAPRLRAPYMEPADIPPIDAMLVSHNHIDHFDALAIELARRTGCTIIGSARTARRAEKNGLKKVVALKRGNETDFKGIRIRAVHAEHPLASDAIGFIVMGTGSIYFSGDTRFSHETIYDLSGFPIDTALAQAACARYPLAGRDGMDLTDLTHFAELVKPSWTIPLHLDCIGKWLDIGRNVRIMNDNKDQVSMTLDGWIRTMASKSLGAKILEPGKPWQPARKEANAG